MLPTLARIERTAQQVDKMLRPVAPVFAAAAQHGPAGEGVLPRLELHPGQEIVAAGARRFNVLDCGRRFGKTIFGLDLLKEPLEAGYPCGWFAPSYKYLLEVWQDARTALKPITARSNATERRIELTTGGVLECWTLDGPDGKDAGRSRKYKRVIIDEAAKVPHLELCWTEAIRATLTDYQGDAWFLSTPKGRNFFWRIYERGVDPLQEEWASWQMPTLTNPFIVPEEIEQARRDLPDSVFRQEYLADFLEDGGGVFRKVRKAATLLPQEAPADGHEYVMGVDWGRHQDFTALTVYDASSKAVAALDRFTGIDYQTQLDRLRALARRFRVRTITAELNSMGGPLVEQLMGEGLPVEGFQTTNESKTGIIRELERALEGEEILLINDPVLVSEMEAYEQERLPSGKWRFGAPEGLHDDTVVSLALALYGANHSSSFEILGWL
jgi:hypothetical protein